MKVDELPKMQREAYIAITEAKKKDPSMSVSNIGIKLGINPSAFYQARKKLQGSFRKGRKNKVVMHTLEADATPTIDHVIAFVGNSQSVVNSVKEFLR